MTIETLEHQYYVVHKREDTPLYDLYHCREIKERRHESYDVFCVKDQGLIYRLIPEFTDKNIRTDFEDLYEYFSRDGNFYMVFMHSGGKTLFRMLEQERVSLQERLALGKNLLERILLLNMPETMLHQVLRDENLLALEDLEIRFQYALNDFPHASERLHGENVERLENIFRKLFEPELRLQKSNEILKFIQWLPQARQEGYLEIYRRYERLGETFAEGGKPTQLRPNTFLFKAWDKVKAALPVLKKMLILAALGVLLGYLIYSILFQNQAVESFSFQNIGTLKIQ